MFYSNIKLCFLYSICILCLISSSSLQSFAQTGCDYDQSNMENYFDLEARPFTSTDPDECCFVIYLVNTSDCDIWYHSGSILTLLGPDGQDPQRNIAKDKTPSIQAILGPDGEIPIGGSLNTICIDKDAFPAIVRVKVTLQDPQNPSQHYTKEIEVVINDCTGEIGCCPDITTQITSLGMQNGCCVFSLDISPEYLFSCQYDVIEITQNGSISSFLIPDPFTSIQNYIVTICNGTATTIELKFIQNTSGGPVVRCVRELRITCDGEIEEIFGATSGGGGSQKVGNSTPGLQGNLVLAPNPVVDMTNITYTVNAEVHVQLELYNSYGQRVQVMAQGVRSEGTHTVEYATKHLAAGMYYVYLKLGNQVVTMPVTVIR